MTELYRKLQQYLANPVIARARSLTTSGKSIQINLPDGRTVTAIAITNISSNRVLAATTGGGTWYAFSEQQAKVLNETTSVTRTRRKIQPEEELLPFLVIVWHGVKYSSERIELPFDERDILRREYANSYLNKQEESRILFSGSPDNTLVYQNVDVYYFDENNEEISSFEDLLIVGFVQSILSVASQIFTGLYGRINCPRLVIPDATRNGYYYVIKEETGVDDVYDDLIAPTESYSGTPTNIYQYLTPSPQSVTINRGNLQALDGRFGSGSLVYFVVGLSESLEFWSWQNSLPEGMFAVDVTSNPTPGAGHLRTDSLKQTSISNNWNIDYSYTSSTTPQIDYRYVDDKSATYTYSIVQNDTNTANPDLSGSVYEFRALVTATELLEESFTGTEFSYKTNWNPNSITANAGMFLLSSRTEYSKGIDMRRRQEYKTEGAGTLQSYINEDIHYSLIVSWSVTRDNQTDVDLQDTFIFNGFSAPIAYKITQLTNYQFTANDVNIIGTHTESNKLLQQDAMNASTAPQIFVIPQSLDPLDIPFFVDTGSVGPPLFQAGSNFAYALEEDDTTMTGAATIEMNLLKVMAANDNQIFVNRTTGSVNFTYTSRVKFRKGLFNINYAVHTEDSQNQGGLDNDQFAVITFETKLYFLNLPWRVGEEYNNLLTNLWHTPEISNYGYVTFPVINTFSDQRQYSGSIKEEIFDYTNLVLTNELVYYDGAETVINSDNSMFAHTTGSQLYENNDVTITFSSVRLLDCLGVMSSTPGVPSSWTETTTTTFSNDTFQTIETNDYTSVNPRRTPESFIGEEFLVYDRLKRRLYLTELTTVESANVAGFPELYNISLSITSFESLDAGTFYARSNSHFIAVSKNNLASLFVCSRDIDQFPERRLTVNGRIITLAYAENIDTNAELFQGYAHKFIINESNNLVFSEEILYDINKEFTGNAKTDGVFRQLTER